MSNKKLNKKNAETEELKPVLITSATIREGLCNYGYEINTGPGSGDKIPNRKGSSLVHEDMIMAFQSLRVHLAILDDGFKFVREDNNDLEFFQEHEIANLFSITGFKVTGNDDNEGFVLVGEKYVTHGSIGLETPKINKGSNYPFFEELHYAITTCREEVEAYMNGKCEYVPEQLSLNLSDGTKEEEKEEVDFTNPM